MALLLSLNIRSKIQGSRIQVSRSPDPHIPGHTSRFQDPKIQGSRSKVITLKIFVLPARYLFAVLVLNMVHQIFRQRMIRPQMRIHVTNRPERTN